MWKFEPILKPTIWGGHKLSLLKGADRAEAVGESWEVSGVEGSESVVADGPDKGLRLSELIDRYGGALLGEKNYAECGNRFPLLVKFIDAGADLSVQVHPDDDCGLAQGYPNGKSELWYVVGHDAGARLYAGFTRPIEKAEFEMLARSGALEGVLRAEEVACGEFYYIPGRKVHAIGKGCLIAEIQQTLDATYRVYDYGRRDAEGNLRELHLEAALNTIDFQDTESARISKAVESEGEQRIVSTPHFTVDSLRTGHRMMLDKESQDSFVVMVATRGAAELRCGSGTAEIKAGESVLIGAKEGRSVEIIPRGMFEALATYIG